MGLLQRWFGKKDSGGSLEAELLKKIEAYYEGMHYLATCGPFDTVKFERLDGILAGAGVSFGEAKRREMLADVAQLLPTGGVSGSEKLRLTLQNGLAEGFRAFNELLAKSSPTAATAAKVQAILSRYETEKVAEEGAPAASSLEAFTRERVAETWVKYISRLVGEDGAPQPPPAICLWCPSAAGAEGLAGNLPGDARYFVARPPVVVAIDDGFIARFDADGSAALEPLAAHIRHGSERGRGKLDVLGGIVTAPPGNQATWTRILTNLGVPAATQIHVVKSRAFFF